MATIEADVLSHAEAVLHGRLSKITQEKIHLEQQQINHDPIEVSNEGEEASAIAKKQEEKKVGGGRQVILDLRKKLQKTIR